MMFTNHRHPGLDPSAWRKSSRSDGNSACLMVQATPALVGVCDSKQDQGPVLAFDPQQWSAFTAAVSSGQFTA